MSFPGNVLRGVMVRIVFSFIWPYLIVSKWPCVSARHPDEWLTLSFGLNPSQFSAELGKLCRFSGRTGGKLIGSLQNCEGMAFCGSWAVQRLKIYDQSWNSIGDVLQCVLSSLCEVSAQNRESVQSCVQVFRFNTDGRNPGECVWRKMCYCCVTQPFEGLM